MRDLTEEIKLLLLNSPEALDTPPALNPGHRAAGRSPSKDPSADRRLP
jgi:hypothetical protein